MADRESDDRSVDRVDVGEITLHSAGVRQRELGVHGRVEVLLAEEPPAVEDAVVLLSLELGAPRSVIEPFVATKEERRDGAAESEWIAPIVGSDQPAIDSNADSLAAVGAIEPQLSIR